MSISQVADNVVEAMLDIRSECQFAYASYQKSGQTEENFEKIGTVAMKILASVGVIAAFAHAFTAVPILLSGGGVLPFITVVALFVLSYDLLMVTDNKTTILFSSEKAKANTGIKSLRTMIRLGSACIRFGFINMDVNRTLILHKFV